MDFEKEVSFSVFRGLFLEFPLNISNFLTVLQIPLKGIRYVFLFRGQNNLLSEIFLILNEILSYTMDFFFLTNGFHYSAPIDKYRKARIIL